MPPSAFPPPHTFTHAHLAGLMQTAPPLAHSAPQPPVGVGAVWCSRTVQYSAVQCCVHTKDQYLGTGVPPSSTVHMHACKSLQGRKEGLCGAPHPHQPCTVQYPQNKPYTHLQPHVLQAQLHGVALGCQHGHISLVELVALIIHDRVNRGQHTAVSRHQPNTCWWRWWWWWWRRRNGGWQWQQHQHRCVQLGICLVAFRSAD